MIVFFWVMKGKFKPCCKVPLISWNWRNLSIFEEWDFLAIRVSWFSDLALWRAGNSSWIFLIIKKLVESNQNSSTSMFCHFWDIRMFQKMTGFWEISSKRYPPESCLFKLQFMFFPFENTKPSCDIHLYLYQWIWSRPWYFQSFLKKMLNCFMAKWVLENITSGKDILGNMC